MKASKIQLDCFAMVIRDMPEEDLEPMAKDRDVDGHCRCGKCICCRAWEELERRKNEGNN